MWLKVAVATLAFGSISTWSAQLLHPPVRRRCLSGWLDGQPADPAGARHVPVRTQSFGGVDGAEVG